MRIDARSTAAPPRLSAAPRATRPARTDSTAATSRSVTTDGLSSAAATRMVKAENRAAALDPTAASTFADQIGALMASRPPLDMRM